MRLLILLLLLTGCSAKYHMKRADYHYKKAKELDSTLVRVDTVIKEVIVPETHLDTTFLPEPGDTVYLEKDRLKIKYVKLPGDSVFIEGKCETDTVYVKVPVERGIIKYNLWDSYKEWFKEGLGIPGFVFWVLHIGVLLLLIYIVLRKVFG